MSRDLLSYFNREVAWFKRALSAFAEANPQAGANLRIGEGHIEDPHVSRLIESVALLNSRIHARIDDDFPLIVQSLLDHLYPYYLAPKPTMILGQLEPSSVIDKVVSIPRGTLFEMDQASGTTCRFRSCYSTELSPLRIVAATMTTKPFSTPGSDLVKGANAVIELRLESSSTDFDLAAGDIDSLTFHIRAGSKSWRLRDLLLDYCTHIFLASSDLDPAPSSLEVGDLKPIGFDDDHWVLPRSDRTASVYQDLLEYFVYPEKHLFFRIDNLREPLSSCAQNFSLFFYVAETDTDLESQLGKDSFALHCTPLVNLFLETCEPQRIDPRHHAYQVTPDIRSDGDMEVYAIDEVYTIEDSSSVVRQVKPYYTVEHQSEPDSVFWHGERTLSLHQTEHRRGVTDFHILLSSLDKTAAPLDRHTLHVKALCSNGNLPAHLPFGGGTPHFAPQEPISGLSRVSSLTPPTPVRRLSLDQGLLWRLLSHLNLNFLSLVGSGDAGAQLREVLRLYDFGDSPTSKAIVNAVDAVDTKVVSLPVIVDGRPVVCRGIDCVFTFDVSILETNSAFLLGDTLQRFLSKYVSINSFVRVAVKIKGREGFVKRWDPIVGTRLVL